MRRTADEMRLIADIGRESHNFLFTMFGEKRTTTYRPAELMTAHTVNTP